MLKEAGGLARDVRVVSAGRKRSLAPFALSHKRSRSCTLDHPSRRALPTSCCSFTCPLRQQQANKPREAWAAPVQYPSLPILTLRHQTKHKTTRHTHTHTKGGIHVPSDTPTSPQHTRMCTTLTRTRQHTQKASANKKNAAPFLSLSLGLPTRLFWSPND